MKHIYNFFSPCRKKNYLKKTALGLALLLSGYCTVDAQVSIYGFSQSSGTYSPITAGTVLGVATDNTSTGNLNSNVYPLVLPFNFVFNGTSYDTLQVTSNGFITFGTTIPGGTITSPILGGLAYEGAISVFGRDISSIYDVNGVTGDITWKTVGTAPNREVVIQWKDFRPNGGTAMTNIYTFSFQLRLKETSNIIDMVYSGGSYLVGSTALSGTTQVGLRGANNADFKTRLNATTLEFVNSIPGTANSSSQAFNTTVAIPGMPTSGLTYTWTPPTCYVPSGFTGGLTTANTAALSWNAPVSSPVGYDIYYSTSNIAPTASTTPMVQNVSGTSTTINSLTPSTIYYVWVRANCGGGNTSIWSLQPIQIITQCDPPTVTSATGATGCSGSTVTLSAGVNPGVTPIWYDVNSGGNELGTGTSYTTPPLTSTTNYWVSAASIGSDAYIGKTAPTSTSGGTEFGDYGLLFDAYSPMIIKQVDIYPMGSNATGKVVISLKDAAGNILQSKATNVNVSAAGTLNTIELNFKVPLAGMNYRLVVEAANDINSMRREISTGYTYPYLLAGVCNIKAGLSYGASSATYYNFLYNWKITSICESARTMVTATMGSNCLGISETSGKERIKIYPNPFSETVHINKPELIKSAKVIDVSGRMISSISQIQSKLKLNDLPKGMYILRLDMKDGSQQSIKMIKK
ncbi:T9SS type A sorting domain-containing protein [Chryseobacterium sp.]|jgi:hypothetical protein|uniref:Ig-like domain-containing protein n=1 Tax=Chryseobacterium sp. TaxID=1871047 RepID=UPI002848A107|nr:T9SS type A sorting domain-containing protein [Chryseobacterium sp.]MDR3026699.1 T9SS type A sorting domain-containing protein [Chryseobacterium sp.]